MGCLAPPWVLSALPLSSGSITGAWHLSSPSLCTSPLSPAPLLPLVWAGAGEGQVNYRWGATCGHGCGNRKDKAASSRQNHEVTASPGPWTERDRQDEDGEPGGGYTGPGLAPSSPKVILHPPLCSTEAGGSCGVPSRARFSCTADDMACLAFPTNRLWRFYLASALCSYRRGEPGVKEMVGGE